MDLALFDFDGTLTSQDTFTPFIYYASTRKRILLQGMKLLPAIIRYRNGKMDSSTIRQKVTFAAFKGIAESAVSRLGEAYCREMIPKVINPKVMDKLHWHKARGDRVVVVSASLSAYLRPWCQLHQVELMCNHLEVIDGTLTGRFCGPDCFGPQKKSQLQTQYDLDEYPHIYAYGDSKDDMPMLSLANYGYLVKDDKLVLIRALC
jgi:HAD superfamily hydrolase (TIGR01490 family)